MYTTKDLNQDLYDICSRYYVKYKLLEGFINNQITEQNLDLELAHKGKDSKEIEEIFHRLYLIKHKIRENGGVVSKDPIEVAKYLRKTGKLQEAFNVIIDYYKFSQNEEVQVTLGWIMYDYLKGSENNLETYIQNLNILNQLVQYNFHKPSRNIKMLLDNILRSINRVVRSGELEANTIFHPFLNFISNSPQFILEEKNKSLTFMNMVGSNDWSSKELIKEFSKNLSNDNYFILIDIIGFDWLDDSDYLNSKFINKEGKEVTLRPLAEFILYNYCKRLIDCKVDSIIEGRISSFLLQLEQILYKYSDFQWLPYYKIQLLMKINKRKEALNNAIVFARDNTKEFWVWSLMSELVDGDDEFSCLCMGLCCNSKPEMLVGIQERIIPHLIERKLYAEAKFELDSLIKCRSMNGWKIPKELEGMKSELWYKENEKSRNRDSLHQFLPNAKRIISTGISDSEIFVTFINEKKGIINFAYMDNEKEDSLIKEGYFYVNSFNEGIELKINHPYIVKMTKAVKKDNNFKVFDIRIGNKAFANNFISEFSGVFEKIKDFGFIRGAIREGIYVTSNIVEKYSIIPFSTVSGQMVRKWDKRNNRWGWQVIDINTIIAKPVNEFRKEVSGNIDVISRRYGFLQECFIPYNVLREYSLEENDYVVAIAEKSWDKNKNQWAWKVTEVIEVTDNSVGLEEHDSLYAEVVSS